MTVEEVKSTAAKDGLDSKATGRISSAESSSSDSFTGPRAYSKQIDSAFDTTEDPRFYKPIPEYEGIHRWDPDFEWTEDEEKAVVKKVRSLFRSAIKFTVFII
jgi:hypothetical protein